MTVREILLPSRHIALIDEEDWALAAAHKWNARPSKNTVYVCSDLVGGGGVKVLLHRLILGAPIGMQVDHINHEGLDNRRENLRLCTKSQNGGNRQLGSNNTSGYKGVSWFPNTQRWLARIGIDGRLKHLGYFTDPWDAAQAYNAAALAAWGEFAYLNARNSEQPITASEIQVRA